MEYAKQRSLKKLLDSKYGELDWASKVAKLIGLIQFTKPIKIFIPAI